MTIKTRFLSSTALVTLAFVAQLATARAQVFVGSSQPDVEVNLDVLNDLPQGGRQPGGFVHLHHAAAAHRSHGAPALRTAEYTGATTVVGINGVTRMGLDAPAEPETAAPPAKRVAARKHHRHAQAAAGDKSTYDLNEHSLDTDPTGLSPGLARLDPAMLTSADLNRLQILCSSVPTGARPGMDQVSYAPAMSDTQLMASPPAPAPVQAPQPAPAPVSMPVKPARAPAPPAQAPMPAKAPGSARADFDGVAPATSADTTHNLNARELADTSGPTQGPANIPAASGLSMPQSRSAAAGEASRPASPAPVSVPSSTHASIPAVPASTDMQVAALPDAPTQQPMPLRADIQNASMTAPPAPEPVTGPLSNADLRVDFQPGGAIVPAPQMAKLDKVVARLGDNSDLRVELRAFASDGDSASKARRVSLARALAVKSYLTSRGVADERIDVRALGASEQNAGDRVDLFLMR